MKEQSSDYRQLESISPKQDEEGLKGNDGTGKEFIEKIRDIRRIEQTEILNNPVDFNEMLEQGWGKVDADNTYTNVSKEETEQRLNQKEEQARERIKGLVKGIDRFYSKNRLINDLFNFEKEGIVVDEKFVENLPSRNDRLGNWSNAVLRLHKEGVDISNIGYFHKRNLENPDFLAAVRYFKKAYDFLDNYYSIEGAVKGDLLKRVSNPSANKEWARLVEEAKQNPVLV
ncbi:hypothetical protein K9M41_04130 [Candidatus Gracilibacteria bacterium]|nr:hypothetical protein [Candidatus Gracilibacteria bacterium]